MSVVREIVTVQAGNYANFIGTHWWNIQESSFCYVPNSSMPLDINHDILFREGENFQREVTYTPRLVMIDLKGNLKSIQKELPQFNDQESRAEALWDGAVDIIPGRDPGRFDQFFEELGNANALLNNTASTEIRQDLLQDTSDATCDFESNDIGWSNFLKTSLHSRSYCLLEDQRSTEDENPVELYNSGEATYIPEGKETVEDSLRKTIEECDYLQGFQLIFDAHNGFAGIANSILQHLEDEYQRKPSLCFPVFQNEKAGVGKEQKAQMHRLYSVLVSMSNLKSHCSLFSPLSLNDDVIALDGPYRKFPYVQYNEDLMYHTGALLAAGIETLTSQYRLKSTKFQLSDITETMSLYGRKLVSSNISLPFPMNEDMYLSSMIDSNIPEYFMTSLTPYFNPSSQKSLMQYAVLRGIPKTKFLGSHRSPYQGLGPEELFGQYLNKYSSSSVTAATVFDEKCSVADPFPNFFSSAIGANGFLSATPRPTDKCVNKVAVAGCFTNTDSAAQFIESLLAPANKRSFKDYVRSVDVGIENDDYQEVVQNLMGLQENYQNY